jgi:transposase
LRSDAELASVFRDTLCKKEQGHSLRQIATKFGVGCGTVRARLLKG